MKPTTNLRSRFRRPQGEAPYWEICNGEKFLGKLIQLRSMPQNLYYPDEDLEKFLGLLEDSNVKFHGVAMALTCIRYFLDHPAESLVSGDEFRAKIDEILYEDSKAQQSTEKA